MTPLPPAILWIDGVGGFRILRGDRIGLGAAFVEPAPDIAILADLARDHARLHRDREGYWLHAERSAAVNLTPVDQALLQPGDRITLASSCQLLFERPEPLSASARLTMISGHRFAEPVDAVLLMADALTLENSPRAHVVVPGLSGRAVLCRQGDEFVLRSPMPIRSDGQPTGDRVTLRPGVAVRIQDVTMTLEVRA